MLIQMPTQTRMPNYRSRLACVALLLIAFACTKKAEEERPANVLAPTQMVRMLTAAYINEGQTASRRFVFDSARATAMHLWAATAKANQTDTATFTRSLIYYSKHLKEYNLIYQDVLDSLAVAESRLRK